MSPYKLTKLLPEEWSSMSEDAHLTTFGVNRPKELDRHHFVMLVTHEKNLGGYFTCLEMDKETLYIQFGGVFPTYQKTVNASVGYALFIEWAAKNYAAVWTRIENTNIPMIRLAMKVGFLITGVSVNKEKTFLELKFGGFDA